MRDYLGKAMETLTPGTQDPERDYLYHYTHLLPESLRNEGYEIKTHEGVAHFGMPVVDTMVTHGNKKIGHLNTMVNQREGFMRIHSARVDEAHRSKGIGIAMYEAALSHAKKLGLKTLVGGIHSTMAHNLHKRLAEKHGLNYEAGPSIAGPYSDYSAWANAPAGSHDQKYEPYKIDLQPEVKKAEPITVPTRFLMKYEPNLYAKDELLVYEGAAMAQSGTWAQLLVQLDGVRRFAGIAGTAIPLNKARYLLSEDDFDDLQGVALRTYNIPDTEDARMGLEATIKLEPFNKSILGVESYKIAPANTEGTTIADAVQRAADSGYINAVQLNGKHSKGTMIAKDPQTKKVYLLKPGSGKNSPAKGVNEIAATQSEREAAFWHVANKWGIGDVFPRADLILVNGHQTAAMELLGVSYRNMGTKKKEDRNLPARILEPYRQNATLFKWSLIDYVLGNPDRHSQNMMVDPDNRQVRLIDHGSALAGGSFDPAEDDNSFIPFYLRAWTDRKFKEMQPHERTRAMPGLNTRAEQVFDQWVDNINEDSMAAILRDYNVDPGPALERLAIVRAMPGPKWVVLNKLWSGAV
jgi:GNAT superfamily N-acetyltransferase